MFKRLSLIAVILTWFAVPADTADNKKISVVVLPFEINARETLSYLQAEIPAAIGRHLQQEGADVLPVSSALAAGWIKSDRDEAAARRFGLEAGVDAVVWGSATWLGNSFSLDTNLIQIFGSQPPTVFTISGQGLENLPVRVKDLSDDIVLRLFDREKIARIRIEGNQRIEVDAIRRVIKTAPDDIYSVKSLSDDLKSIYAMGYFDDIRINAEDSPAGKVIVIQVKEKPTIRLIKLEGNRAYKDDEIMENLTLKTGSILNIFVIQNNIRRIEELYKEKNFHNVQVSYEIQPVGKNQADLVFKIKEGDKLRVKNIRFIGNEAYTKKELLKVIETSESGIFSWITDSGELKRDELLQDASRLTEHYHNNGYIRARVGEPEVEFKEKWIDVTIKINEGPRYRVGKVDIVGDLLFPKEQLLENIKIDKEEFYSRTTLRNDVLTLTDLYSDIGYAFTEVNPRIDENAEELIVDISYVMRKNKLVYFEEIIIEGNTKTRDKVIRRQLEVFEQDQFSGAKLKRSIRNLNRLDYFSDVKVNTVRGSSEDKIILKLDVEEKSTGQFSFGGGYSNVEELFLTGSISQKNLFGYGWILNLRGSYGSQSKKYDLSFTEPWLFDRPLSAGFRVYSWDFTFDTYDKDSVGGNIRFGYPIFTDTRLTIGFYHDVARVKITDPNNAPQSIIDLVERFGNSNYITNSLETLVRYDTRDRTINPTKGWDNRIGVEYAGFGGDIGFIKTNGEVGYYHPLYQPLSIIGHARARAGFALESEGKLLPDYELFFLGGINTIRGYNRDELSPVDADGNEIGGDSFVQLNLEVIFPLIKNAGVIGIVFYDIGGLANQEAADPAQQQLGLDDLRQSVGAGFRWNSPVGPIRVEYGFKIDPLPGESPGQWEFAFGGAF